MQTTLMALVLSAHALCGLALPMPQLTQDQGTPSVFILPQETQHLNPIELRGDKVGDAVDALPIDTAINARGGKPGNFVQPQEGVQLQRRDTWLEILSEGIAHLVAETIGSVIDNDNPIPISPAHLITR